MPDTDQNLTACWLLLTEKRRSCGLSPDGLNAKNNAVAASALTLCSTSLPVVRPGAPSGPRQQPLVVNLVPSSKTAPCVAMPRAPSKKRHGGGVSPATFWVQQNRNNCGPNASHLAQKLTIFHYKSCGGSKVACLLPEVRWRGRASGSGALQHLNIKEAAAASIEGVGPQVELNE